MVWIVLDKRGGKNNLGTLDLLEEIDDDLDRLGIPMVKVYHILALCKPFDHLAIKDRAFLKIIDPRKSHASALNPQSFLTLTCRFVMNIDMSYMSFLLEIRRNQNRLNRSYTSKMVCHYLFLSAGKDF